MDDDQIISSIVQLVQDLEDSGQNPLPSYTGTSMNTLSSSSSSTIVTNHIHFDSISSNQPNSNASMHNGDFETINLDEENGDDDDEVVFVGSSQSGVLLSNRPESDDVVLIIQQQSSNHSPSSSSNIFSTRDHFNSPNRSPLAKSQRVSKRQRKSENSQPDPLQTASESNFGDENCCVICTDPWTNDGPHQLCTLKCGHLFGKSCIENWFKVTSNAKCPQCNKKFRKADIIKIYATSLKTLDTRERNEILSKLCALEEIKKDQDDLIKNLKNECSFLRKENQKLKSSLLNRPKNLPRFTENLNAQRNQSGIFLSHVKNLSWIDSKDNVKKSSTRYQCYFNIFETFVVNYETKVNSCFPTSGLKKVFLNDSKSETFLIHSLPIKGMSANQYDGTLATISRDKTLKISSVMNKNVMMTANLTEEPWSVHHVENSFNIWIGLRSGRVELWDKRVFSQPLLSMVSQSLSPIISMKYIKKQVGSSLVLTKLDSCWIYDFTEAFVNHSIVRLDYDGKVQSYDYDSKSRLSLLSFRPSKKHHQMTHYVLNQDFSNEISQSNPPIVKKIEGTSSDQILLSRSRIFQNPVNYDSVLVCSNDGIAGAKIWDHHLRFCQPINLDSNVFDFELINTKSSEESTNLLSCLTEESLKIFKINKAF
ncbi:hypothetical protein NH340_JMT03822 [Sarcoptes scabiei]|nr:hypothetical protein NH340_JMT03822 [Sarcoptes scabiei]